jgi:hypothetical protein
VSSTVEEIRLPVQPAINADESNDGGIP